MRISNRIEYYKSTVTPFYAAISKKFSDFIFNLEIIATNLETQLGLTISASAKSRKFLYSRLSFF
jgi:hypothetical protein